MRLYRSLVRPSWLTIAFIPIASVITLVGILAVSLNRRAPDEAVTPMSLMHDGWVALPVNLLTDRTKSTGTDVRLTLQVGDIALLRAADRIELAMATYGEQIPLSMARLAVVGTNCSFDAVPGTILLNNSYLRLARGPQCDLEQHHTPVQLEFAASTPKIAFLALWTVIPPAGVAPTAEVVTVAQTEDSSRVGTPWVRGRFVTERRSAGATYGELLTFLWDEPLPGPWLWALMCTAATALIVGAMLLSQSTTVWPQAVGAGLLSGAMGVIYAMIIPPFHAPDEPRHLYSFAQVAGRPELFGPIVVLGARGHVERIRTRADERFRPADRERPSSDAVLGGPIVDPRSFALDNRSPAARLYWSAAAAAAAAKGLSASQVLLRLRLLNAFAFAAAVATATLLLTVPSVSGRALYAPSLLTIPTLAFFAMHVSNYSLLVVVYVVCAAVAARIFSSIPWTAAAGASFGVATGLGTYVSRSFWPMLLVLVPLLFYRLKFQASGPRIPARDTWRFWACVAVPIALFSVLAVPSYVLHMERFSSVIVGPVQLTRTGIAAAVVLGATMVILLEQILAPVLRVVIYRAFPAIRSLLILGGVLLSAGLVSLLVGVHMVLPPPLAAYGEADSVSPQQYAREVMAAAAGMFGAYPPDFLLVSSFWGGFGWLETATPLWLSSLLSGCLALLLLIYIVRALAARQLDRLAMVGVLALGLSATLAAYAASSAWSMDYLHGRYLIGWYLVLLAPVMSLVMEVGSKRRWVGAAVWVAFAAVHIISVWTILERYFGP